MSVNPFYVKFWGVRGSHPVPGPETVAIGGNTPCVEVGVNGKTIILDAGTGIIDLGRSLISRSRQQGTALGAIILFSHYHHDHIQGLPYFAPAYVPDARLHFLGPDLVEQGLGEVLDHNQKPPVFPVTLQDMGAAKEIHCIQDTDVILVGENGVSVQKAGRCESGALPQNTIRIRTLRSYAHPGDVLVYRIEHNGYAVVYATDTEGYIGTDRRLVNFAQNADVLIHDAQYTDQHYTGQYRGFPCTQGFGHSTASMACRVAAAAGVKQLFLFHHDPNYDDETIQGIQTRAQTLFPNVLAAREGLTITLEHAAHDMNQPRLATVGG